MKSRQYSNFALLAMANRKQRRADRAVSPVDTVRHPDRREGGAGDEPGLPAGYRHIRSAIRALLAAEFDLSQNESGDGGAVLERVHEALAGLQDPVGQTQPRDDSRADDSSTI